MPLFNTHKTMKYNLTEKQRKRILDRIITKNTFINRKIDKLRALEEQKGGFFNLLQRISINDEIKSDIKNLVCNIYADAYDGYVATNCPTFGRKFTTKHKGYKDRVNHWADEFAKTQAQIYDKVEQEDVDPNTEQAAFYAIFKGYMYGFIEAITTAAANDAAIESIAPN